MKFIERMLASWSMLTSQKKERPMSRYNFMLELEISNISTDDPAKVENYYRKYLDGIQKQKSE